MSKRHKKILSRTATRDLPMFMVEASYGKQLPSLFEDSLGFRLSRSFVLLDRGTAIVFRDGEQWHSQMPSFLALALEDSKKSQTIKRLIELTAQSICHLKVFQLVPTAKCLNSLSRLISDGMAGMVLAHWLPIYHEQRLAVYRQNDTDYINQSRVKTEKFFSLAADVAYSFVSLLSRDYGTDANLLKYATSKELQQLITTSKIDEVVLRARQSHPTLFVEDTLYLGDTNIADCLNHTGYQLEVLMSNDSNIIRGVKACAGSVVGRVQIINSRQQFDQFEAGNILVAAMTSPEYTSLIKQAAAVITDEGGLLSHAAILCRELNKPCIIGTRNASYLLKDYQEVRLEANEGTITLLD